MRRKGKSVWPALSKSASSILGAQLSPMAVERLRVYDDILRKWQRKMNLVAPSTLESLWERHFLDSYQLIALAGRWRHWVDMGSGGGFPGMVVALVQPDDTDGVVHLIEADGRKAAFLQEVSRETTRSVEIHNGRIECILPALCESLPIQVVSARALAPMGKLITYARPALDQGATGLFLKGKGLADELTLISADIRLHIRIEQSRSDRDGKIVIATKYGTGSNSI
jgi:16S rRNA (guanine527-N7)-methyltransferase